LSLYISTSKQVEEKANSGLTILGKAKEKEKERRKREKVKEVTQKESLEVMKGRVVKERWI